MHETRKILGGSPKDFEQENLKSADSLMFPEDLKPLQDEYHKLRVALTTVRDQYLAARGTDFGVTPAIGYDTTPSPNIPGVPKNGWRTTDELLSIIGWRTSCLLDVMRGVDGGEGGTSPSNHGGDSPWLTDPSFTARNTYSDPTTSNASRMAVWHYYKDYSIVDSLLDELVDNVPVVDASGGTTAPGSDLPGKAELATFKGLLAALSSPIIAPTSPAPVADPSWATVDPTHLPKEAQEAVYFIKLLDPVIRKYSIGVVDGGGKVITIRSPEYIRVAQVDATVNALIEDTNQILKLSASGGKNTFSKVMELYSVRSSIMKHLDLWNGHVYNVVRSTIAPPDPGVIPAFRSLAGAIGTSRAASSKTALYTFTVNWRFDAEPFPAIDVRAVFDATALEKAHSPPVLNSVVDLSKAVNRAHKAYNTCRSSIMLDFDHCDDLFNNIVAAVIALRTDYEPKTPRSWNTRIQGFQHITALEQAINALIKALKDDHEFSRWTADANPALWKPDARALFNSLIWLENPKAMHSLSLVEAAQMLIKPTCPIPKSTVTMGVPLEPPIVTTLIDPNNYKRTTVVLGKQVADLLWHIFRDGSGGAWRGIRTQYKSLRNLYIKGSGGVPPGTPLVDPISGVYVNVADDAVDFAQACFDFADKPTEALIVAGAAAKSQLYANLRLLEQDVLTSVPLDDIYDPTNNPGRKTAFSAAIQRAVVSLNAVPTLSLPDQGASASLLVARPLTESQRLIHYKSAPTESVTFASDSDFAVSAGQKVVLEAKTPEDLEGMVARLPKHGPSLVFGLVVDRPGDMTALYKAVAIRLDLRLPPEIERKVADRKNAATGWLYNIVQFESGAYYTSQHDYIKPELYAV
jgi:hypothetical protein